MLIAIAGGISEIIISGSKIDVMQTKSFCDLSCLKKIRLQCNSIDVVQSYSMSSTEMAYLHIQGNRIARLKTSAFTVNVSADSFIEDNVLGDVESYAFSLGAHLKMFYMINNSIDIAYSNAFHMSLKGKVDIVSNRLLYVMRRVFYAIRCGTLIFKNNVVAHFDQGALDFDARVDAVQMAHTKLEANCSCSLKSRVEKIASTYAVDHVLFDNALFCKVQRGYDNLDDWFLDAPACQQKSAKIEIIVPVSVSLALLVIAGIVFLCWRNRCRPHKLPSARNMQLNDRRWIMAVPDTRLYQETELQVQVEYAVPLRSSLMEQATD